MAGTFRYPSNPTVYDNAALHRWVAEHGGKTEVVGGRAAAHTVIITVCGPIRVRPGSVIIDGPNGFVVNEML